MPTERPQTAAFTHEYPRDVSPPLLYKDIVSYLGEYRFELQKDSYELVFDGAMIRDSFIGEPMTKRARRAIKKKEDHWEKTTREEAELQGFKSLEEQLESAEDGDLIVWLSPPGPKDEGYGDYGFVFAGEISPYKELSRGARLLMTAYRVEQPNLEDFNEFFQFFIEDDASFQTAEEFISHPQLARGITKQMIEELLPESFSFRFSNEGAEQFQAALQKLHPHINEYIRMVQTGKPEKDLREAFNALENYALFLRMPLNKPQGFSFPQLINYFGYQPKRVGGSCGSSSSGGLSSSNNLLNSISSLGLSRESNNFHCPSCHRESQGPVGNQCPNCHITREEAQQRGLTTC